MTAVVIPTSDAPDYTQRVRLDDVDYKFHFLWNGRDERWRLSIFSDEGAPLVRGLALEVNWPLLRYYHSKAGLPAGELVAVATANDDTPPGLTELGENKRVELTYYPLANV